MKKSDFVTLNADAPFGIRVWYLRDKYGISQAYLAKQLHYDTQVIQRWEEGKSNPRGYQVSAVAGLFGVDALWLMGQNNGGN